MGRLLGQEQLGAGARTWGGYSRLLGELKCKTSNSFSFAQTNASSNSLQEYRVIICQVQFTSSNWDDLTNYKVACELQLYHTPATQVQCRHYSGQHIKQLVILKRHKCCSNSASQVWSLENVDRQLLQSDWLLLGGVGVEEGCGRTRALPLFQLSHPTPIQLFWRSVPTPKVTYPFTPEMWPDPLSYSALSVFFGKQHLQFLASTTNYFGSDITRISCGANDKARWRQCLYQPLKAPARMLLKITNTVNMPVEDPIQPFKGNDWSIFANRSLSWKHDH